jgi:hypothetical protein
MSPVAAEFPSAWSAPGPAARGVEVVVTDRVPGGAVAAGLVVDFDAGEPPQPANPTMTLRKGIERAIVRARTPRTLAE